MPPILAPPNHKAKPHVVIIGAGFGGLAAVRGLAHSGVTITLVDRQNHHVFQPLLYQVATAGLSPADIAAPIRSIVKHQKQTRVLLAEVTGVNAGQRRVLLSDGATLDYDALVIATGARHSYFGRDEWAEHAPGIKTIDDATRVRRNILLAMERAETIRQESLPDRDEYLTFVVVGGGPTGVEMAGAIAELTRHAADMDFHFITRRCLRIILVEAGDRLLPTFPAKLGDAARKALEGLGVIVRLNGRVTDIGHYGVTIGDQRIATTTVIWAAGVQASDAAKWLDVEADRSGRVRVEPDLSVPGHSNIFAIGDTASLVDASGRPVPGVAPAAKQEGLHVARSLLARFTGSRPPPPFRYRNWGNLATIGRKRAVAEIGSLQIAGLPAWLLWSTAHIYFLVGFRNRIVVGANWLWNYLTFERGARLITGMTHATRDPAETLPAPSQVLPDPVLQSFFQSRTPLIMSQDTMNPEVPTFGQQVLVLQGGGALGAYQVGVYQALDQAGIDLDWVVGTSIGAINAAIIAGSPRAERMERLRAFWKRVEHGHVFEGLLPSHLSSPLRNWLAVSAGITGFFKPHAPAFLSPFLALSPGEAGYYSVEPLKHTLADLIDFDLVQAGPTRLTVGAANVRTSEMIYFDSRAVALDIRHVLASGALPPAFPAVEIDGHHYWDGGILSNTPVEVVFDDSPRRDSMVYAVHVWNPEGATPQTMRDVENRRKEVQYSSRSATHIARQRQLHRLRHVISELANLLPAEQRADSNIHALASYGCRTRMHVVRLLAPRLSYEDQSKDLDFSLSGIRQRWEAGYAHTMRVLENAPWRGEFDPLEGFVLHEPMGSEPIVTSAARD